VDILTTELFRFTTTAGPEAVWRTLTSSQSTPRYFHGLSLRSDWRPGSAVTARGRGWRLVGEVLAVAEPRRLSFTLAADGDQPETFVTWEVHRVDDGSPEAGSIVRLYVDEPDGGDDTESAWLPVVSALQSVLDEAGRTSTTSR
jgi:uncharacterized protein YndB with AHSA1/START domain